MTTVKPIGLLGGTFDPIHLGHLHLACEIQTHFQLKTVRFIPCHQNPLKMHPPQASAEDRIHMLSLALKPFPAFSIDLREIKKTLPSYTIETLRGLKTDFSETPLAFIMAADTFMQFTSWKDWEEILDYTHLIVGKESTDSLDLLPASLAALLRERQSHNPAILSSSSAGAIFLQPLTPQIPIASTTIRNAIADKKTIHPYVPSNIMEYIAEKRLYGMEMP